MGIDNKVGMNIKELLDNREKELGVLFGLLKDNPAGFSICIYMELDDINRLLKKTSKNREVKQASVFREFLKAERQLLRAIAPNNTLNGRMTWQTAQSIYEDILIWLNQARETIDGRGKVNGLYDIAA